MNQYSKKRQKLNREYLKATRAFKEAHPICMVQSNVCTGVATQIHHAAGRVGKNFLDESKWVATCFRCHCKIEENPIWAKENGFSLSRLSV